MADTVCVLVPSVNVAPLKLTFLEVPEVTVMWQVITVQIIEEAGLKSGRHIPLVGGLLLAVYVPAAGALVPRKYKLIVG